MKKFVVLALGLSVASSALAARDINELYNKSCNACHGPATAAAMKAPLVHDAKAWEPRLKKGMPTLVQNVTNGFNVMPARGLCMDCTAGEYEALIKFMSTAK